MEKGGTIALCASHFWRFVSGGKMVFFGSVKTGYTSEFLNFWFWMRAPLFFVS